MAVIVKCPCGKRLKAPDAAAGKRVRCPACKQVLRVPKPVEDDPDQELLEVVDEGAPDEGAVCPACKSSLPAGSILCVNCGLDLQTGQQVGSEEDSGQRKRNARRRQKGAWKTVRIGLTLVYWGLMAIVVGILGVVAALLVAIVGGLLGAAGPQVIGAIAAILGLVLLVASLVCIAVSPLLQFIGQCMSVAAPVERIRALAVGAVVCSALWGGLLFPLALQGRQQAQEGSVLQVLFALAFWAQPILFLLFIRGIAARFKDRTLADRVKNLLIFKLVLFGLTELLSVAQVMEVPAMAAIAGIAGIGIAIATVVAFAWYIGVVRDVRSLLP